jgi:hypothetical protein
MAKSVNRQLLQAAQHARTVLFNLMLAERAEKVRGTYTEAYEKLDKAASGRGRGENLGRFALVSQALDLV